MFMFLYIDCMMKMIDIDLHLKTSIVRKLSLSLTSSGFDSAEAFRTPASFFSLHFRTSELSSAGHELRPAGPGSRVAAHRIFQALERTSEDLLKT